VIKTAIKDSKKKEKFHGIPLPVKTRNYRIGAPAAVYTELPEERRPG